MQHIVFSLLALILLTACSGAETIPGDTSAFVTSAYTNYAWRSEPLAQTGYTTDRGAQADPAIRDAVNEKLGELGYTLVDRSEAEFLIEYVAAQGINEGVLSSTSSIVPRYPSATINRQVDGATVDNAYALGGAKEMSNLVLVFVDATDKELLWQLRISKIVKDSNRVDTRAVRRVIRDGLSSLPPAPR